MILALILALLVSNSLACSVGVTGQGGPYFMAPNSYTNSQPVPDSSGEATPVPELPQEGDVALLSVVPTPTLPTLGEGGPPPDSVPLLYYTQAGDTLPVVATRFGVDPSEITSPQPLPTTALLSPDVLLIIPHRLANTTSAQKILPDSEVIFSPSAIDFNVEAFVNQAGGYLSEYRQWLNSTQWTSGAKIVERVATENSISPRLLLALLEYQSHWVYGQPENSQQEKYPLGKVGLDYDNLYTQLAWVVNHLSVGYYGWREGLLTDIQFSDGVTARLAPDLNAGTVALQYYLAQIYDTPGWVAAVEATQGIPALYERMFGNPWVRARDVEPLYPPDLTQPTLILPFLIGQYWSYTGGPHGAWEQDGARAAIDFAPGSTESGCAKSDAWVVAMAPGLIVRTGPGLIVQDMDGDGLEQTGWVLLYLHISNPRVRLGDWVETSDYLGHPSCEGGHATGTHVHIARKYNGEWIAADGPLPFVLSGWRAHAGAEPYEGTMTRGSDTIYASVYGASESLILREREEP
ncbi:MAG: hypothetical protein JW726_14265 [Anaerolineales bacterium]|nr:hypothetical protein [Anaerolineales bacterium]